MVELNPTLVVPGHGPLCDSRGINAVRDYLLFVEKEARSRFDAGKRKMPNHRGCNLLGYTIRNSMTGTAVAGPLEMQLQF